MSVTFLRRSFVLLLLLGLSACSRDEAPKPEPTAAAADRPTPPPLEEFARVPRRPAVLPPPAPPRPKEPLRDESIPVTLLPAFTFRTMDRKEVRVQINGADLSTTPCLWTITRDLKSTDAAVPAGSPPEGSRFVGSTQSPDDPESKAELYVLSDREALAKIPKLRWGECVLYVRGVIGRVSVQGALLLYIPGYRYTDYTPLVDPEGEEASRNLRTLWFERIPSE
jgi:hypothetical protein